MLDNLEPVSMKMQLETCLEPDSLTSRKKHLCLSMVVAVVVDAAAKWSNKQVDQPVCALVQQCMWHMSCVELPKLLLQQLQQLHIFVRSSNCNMSSCIKTVHLPTALLAP